MNDTAFDKLLRSALLDAVARDYETALTTADGDTTVAFSRRHQQRMKRMLHDPFSYAQRQTAPQWRRTLKTIVAAALILITVTFSASMLFIPEVRATVVRIVTEWFDTHTSFNFTGGSAEHTGAEYWYPAYLPEGFNEIEFVDMMGDVTVTYENAEGIRLYLDYFPTAQQTALGVDNEQKEYVETLINGNTAHLFEAEAEGGTNQLLWFSRDETTAFILLSSLDSDELIRIAESMQKKN